MLQSQREKLQNRTSDWMAIGVTQTGEPVRSIHVPWYYDTNAGQQAAAIHLQGQAHKLQEVREGDPAPMNQSIGSIADDRSV